MKRLTEQRAVEFLTKRGYSFLALPSKKDRKGFLFQKKGTKLVTVDGVCCKLAAPMTSYLGKRIASTYDVAPRQRKVAP